MNVHRLLQSRVYTGDFDWNGRTYRGSHEPLISTALFERVQEILEGRYSTKEKVTKHEFTFSGLVHCGHCGCALVGEKKKGKYVYYHCTGNKGKCPEPARDLISEGLSIFQSQRDKKKIAEAQTELALSYWRTGEYDNASDLLKLALAHLTNEIELKARAIQRLAMVEQYARRPHEAVRFLTENSALFEKISNQTLTGCYHQTLGDALENLWESEGPGDYLDRALVEYAAASYHFEQADHKRYRANVENNLGFLYLKINFFKEAHEHLGRARRIFTSLKDKGAVAQVDETRARAFLQQGRNAEAEKAADSSVRTLEKSDMQAELAESLTTHGRALARLENYGMALSAFRRAVSLSQKIGSRNRAAEAALAAFQEMEERLAVMDHKNVTTGRNLSEEIQLLEHDLIKHALETNKGSVTRSARALGISYQELSYMLNTRHADLLSLRTPPRRRPPKG